MCGETTATYSSHNSAGLKETRNVFYVYLSTYNLGRIASSSAAFSGKRETGSRYNYYRPTHATSITCFVRSFVRYVAVPSYVRKEECFSSLVSDRASRECAGSALSLRPYLVIINPTDRRPIAERSIVLRFAASKMAPLAVPSRNRSKSALCVF